MAAPFPSTALLPSSWLCVGDFNEIVDQSEKLGVLHGLNDKWKVFAQPWKSVN
jgi:hypothetical protein